MDMRTIKTKISSLVKERNTNLQQTTGKIDMLTQIVNSQELTQPIYPFECSESNREIFEKNLETLKKNLEKKLKSVSSKLEKLTTFILIMINLKCLMTQLKDVCQGKKLG